jgi:predicted nucleotidyltransferase
LTTFACALYHTPMLKQMVPGLDPITLDEILRQILKYKKPEKIVIFGSRAGRDFDKTSDIDVAIFAKSWSSEDVHHIHDQLEEYVKTPLKFDVIDFYRLTKKSLKEKILREGKIIYSVGKYKTFPHC